MESYYDVLGVPKDASADVIKKAYRKKAFEHHPDQNQGVSEAEDQFKKVQSAYETLSDPQKRQDYDLFGAEGRKRQGPQGPQNFWDIFGGMGGFGQGPSQPQRPQTQRARIPPDIQINLQITLKEALGGCKRQLKIKRAVACKKCETQGRIYSEENCDACNGTGMLFKSMHNMQLRQTCNRCGGAGKVSGACMSCGGRGCTQKEETVALQVPAGIANKNVLHLKDVGNTPLNQPTGSLYATIYYNPSEQGVTALNNDLHMNISVPFHASLQAKIIEINVLNERTIQLPLKPIHPEGHLYILDGQGLNKNGNAYVTVSLYIPELNDKEEKEKLLELTHRMWGEATSVYVPEDRA